MYTDDMKTLIDDIAAEKLANTSLDDLIAEFHLSKDEIDLAQDKVVKSFQQYKMRHKKEKLSAARRNLENERKRFERIDVNRYLSRVGMNAICAVETLTQKSHLTSHKELTVAYRNGGDMSESVAEQILASWIAMGVIGDDKEED